MPVLVSLKHKTWRIQNPPGRRVMNGSVHKQCIVEINEHRSVVGAVLALEVILHYCLVLVSTTSVNLSKTGLVKLIFMSPPSPVPPHVDKTNELWASR